MRLPILLLEVGLILSGLSDVAHAQNPGESNSQTVPVGQTILHFEFPVYQEGKLHYTLAAAEAKGITLNRVETSNLKIDIYDNGAVTSTITSPKADLIVGDQKMRTKNTVLIERADMEASSQDCDFDVKLKKFLMRTNVKVLLKHFDLNGSTPGGSTTPKPMPAPQPAGAAPAPVIGPVPPESSSAPSKSPTPDSTPGAHSSDSLLSSPGSYSDTNAAPIPSAK